MRPRMRTSYDDYERELAAEREREARAPDFYYGRKVPAPVSVRTLVLVTGLLAVLAALLAGGLMP